MRPLARSRLVWWDSFVSALVVLIVLAAIGAVILLAQWGGRRLVSPLLGILVIFFASGVQNRRLGFLLAIVGGWLAHG